MSLRKIIVLTVIAVAALATTANASAASRDYTLSVIPQTQFVSSGQNAVLSWSAGNNTTAAANCSVVDAGSGFAVFNGTIQPGTSAGGQYSTAALYKNTRFKLDLYCDGIFVRSDYSNVKVRP